MPLARLGRLVPLTIIVATVFTASILLSARGALLIEIAESRKLVQYFIEYSYNPYIRISALAPAIVNSIVWDFRGLDTLYETVVFYTSIVAAIALYRGLVSSTLLEKTRLSPIAMTVARTAAILAIAVAISTALHGHLTPGGGFQGGAILAALLFLFIAIYSAHGIAMKGLRLQRLVVARSLGLLAIVATAIAPLVLGIAVGTVGYVFQNQYKPGSVGGLTYRIDCEPVAGVLLLYNVFEMLIVASGFSIVLLLLSIASSRGE